MMLTGRRVTVAAAIWSLAFLILLALRPLPDRGMLLLANLVQFLSASTAAVLVWRVAARRTTGVVRWGWVLLGGEAAGYAVGMVIWTTYELLLGRTTPFPSWADAAYLTGVPLTLAAIVALSPRPPSRAAWIRAATDLLLAAGALVVIVWPTIVHPLLTAGGLSGWTLALAMAYPVGYALVAGVALRAVSDTGANRRAMTVVTASALVFALVDLLYLYLLGIGRYRTGHLIDPLWVVAHLLLVVAVLQPDAARSPGALRRGGKVRQLAPFVPLLIAAPVLVTASGRLGGPVSALLIAVAFLGLIALRQTVAFAEQRHVTSGLVRSVAEQRSLTENVSDAVLVLAPTGEVLYASPSVERVLGFDPTDVGPEQLGALLDPDQAEEVAAAFLRVLDGGDVPPFGARIRRDDEWRHIDIEAKLRDGDGFVNGVLLTFRDVTDRVRAEQSREEAARTDVLTGLPNREVFRQRLDAALTDQGRGRSEAWVLMLDLDSFKTVNESLGHRVGDELLVAAAGRITAVTQEGFVARLGGDEFAVLLDGDEAEAERHTSALLEQFRQPFALSGLDVVVHCSIGVARERDGADTEALLQAADTALYAAKTQGRDRAATFMPLMGVAVRERLTLKSALPHALERGELELWYQPIVDVGSGAVASFEALMRWRSPEHGLVPPVRFIPLAEESGLILELGRWALESACAQLAEWRARFPGAANLSVAVNVSGRQLEGSGLPAQVEAAVRAAGLPARALIVEVTESLTLTDVAPPLLRKLRDLGIRLAIDDFGTGYSSLGMLQRLPFDILKLDRSFVAPLAAGAERDAAFLRAIVAMAASLDLRTVAEGVETAEHLEVLRRVGVHRAQGYHFSRPAPAADFEPLLRGSPAPALAD